MSYVRWSHSDWYIFESSDGIEFLHTNGQIIVLPSNALDILLARMTSGEIKEHIRYGKNLLKDWLNDPKNIKWKRWDKANQMLQKRFLSLPKGVNPSEDKEVLLIMDMLEHAHHDHEYGQPCFVPPTPLV